MTFKQLVLELMKREGGKRGVNVADMSEIVKCLDEILKEESEHFALNIRHSFDKWKIVKPKRRAKRKAKKG